MVDKTPMLTVGEAKQHCKTAKVRYALGWTDTYTWDAQGLLESQLVKAEPYYIEKGRQEVIKEIEKKMFDIYGGVLKCREGTWEKAYKDWQALKQRYLKPT